MLHDHLGIKKADLDSFLANVENSLAFYKGSWRHRSSHSYVDSLSLITDKYFAAAIERLVKNDNPKTSILAEKSIFELLETHRIHKYVLVTDINKYFESITFSLVKPRLLLWDETKDHVDVIEKLYFHDNGLRRGLTASPAISEIVGLKIDGIVRQNLSRNQAYTRYYDDIIISADSRQDLLVLQATVSSKLENDLGLIVKKRKTKITTTNGTTVLGLVFYDGELTVPKYFKNRLRALEHQYGFMVEDTEEAVRSKMSACGSIYASHFRIIHNTSLDTSSYESAIAIYGAEFHRLKNLLEKMCENNERKM